MFIWLCWFYFNFIVTYVFVTQFLNSRLLCTPRHRTIPPLTMYKYLYFWNYLITPWSGVLLEKLTDFRIVKKFPAFYGARRFIIAFTRAYHLSLSWARLVQSIPLHSNSWRSILILSSYLRVILPGVLFPSDFPYQNSVYTSPLPHTRYMPRLSHSSRLYHPKNIGRKVHIINLLIM
jgi:hypothetical protein